MSDNGASATDIITYIGVPLAVLGVLPILYNTVATLVNASRIKHMLRHSRLTTMTTTTSALMMRSDVVNRVIEIELPRYAVTPWDRFQHRREYWHVAPEDTPPTGTIPGGTWTIFNWKTSAIGFKTQRVEYADQLRLPQAEVRFDELLAYLLDLGAVPDAHGWRLLRSTGLWTPVGCTLMTSPDGLSPALAIAPLDDSDGHLSLSVAWRPEWTTRNYTDLPPYWVSLPAPPGKKGRDDTEESSSSSSKKGEPSTATTDKKTKAGLGLDDDDDDDDYQTPITCQISVDGIVTALTEETRRSGGIARNNTGSSHQPPAVNLDSLYIEHIRVRAAGGGATTDAGVWFASAATAYGTTSQTVLWNYRIPQDILAFAQRETVPCGVLVLLGAAREDETPEWSTTTTTAHAHDSLQATYDFARRSEERQLAMQAEMRLAAGAGAGAGGAAQREAAQRERLQRENMQRISDMRAQAQRAQARREQREMDALSSPKWDTRLVAEHALGWLRANERVDEEYMDSRLVAGHVLHRMVRDGQFAAQLCGMLDRWKTWADLGGMKRADLQALREQTATFCYAALLLALIKGTATVHDGTLSADLQECIRMWRKVRLG